MRQLGEQWIENGRMYKAISGKFNCLGCSLDNGSVMCIHKNIVECEEGQNFIIHDLGPVNEDGCLAEERTGLFPTITKVTDGIWKASVYQNGGLMQIEIEVWATTQQQVIYAWNRRTI